MLTDLYIRNLATIKTANIKFSPNLTVITGETGTGKSMLLNAVSLLLGENATYSLIRDDATSAETTGYFSFADHDNLTNTLTELGVETENGEIEIKRIITSENKSRAFLGGSPAIAKNLHTVSAQLISIHGQNQQLRLYSKKSQAELLDEYSSNSKLRLAYSETYKKTLQTAAKLKEIHEKEQGNLARHEYLETQIAKIEKIAPKAGEDDQLRQLIKRMDSSETIIQALKSAKSALDSESAAIPKLQDSLMALRTVSELDDELKPLLDELSDVFYRTEDVAKEIATYQSKIDFNQSKFDFAHTRLAELNTLTRVFGSTVNDVLATFDEMKSELNEILHSDEIIATLEKELAVLNAELDERAKSLTKSRLDAAKRLTEKVNAELAFLGMAQIRFKVDVTKLDVYNANGIDDIDFLLAPYATAEYMPAGKIASGGELSRIMLAIEIALDDRKNETHTLIFDEIDSGIGGTTANLIAKRLKDLSLNVQVIVVTHLAQIAAVADTQINIAKDLSSEIPISAVHELDSNERVAEIARMLSGNSNETAMKHAREMLDFN
ncbi:MAG: DNA repair protein RecN [Bifidobacteriaceae bacterium]|jgi:DNA repair protein RecN (Recombination protein N)|nr:DNA repair protein RecN [Bifidobacteriaceae bacterium]